MERTGQFRGSFASTAASAPCTTNWNFSGGSHLWRGHAEKERRRGCIIGGHQWRHRRSLPPHVSEW